MNAIQITGVTLDDFTRMVAEMVPPTPSDPMDKRIRDFKVDRTFLIKNFGWTMHKIKKYETTGELRPVFTGDARSTYYLFGACLDLYMKERQ